MHSNPYTKENARQGALHYLMGRGAAGIAGFLTVILLVRFMDVQNYAAYTALSGLVALCGVLSALGMERVISRYVPEGRLYRTTNELGRFVWITSAIRFIAGLLVTLALYLLWPAIDRFLVVSDFKFFSIALGCFIVAEVMFQHFSSVLQALVMQKNLTQVLIIQWVGRLVLIAVFVFINALISWENALWVFAIPEVIGVVCFIVVIKRHLHGLSNPVQTEATKAHWPNWGNVTDVGMHNYGFTLLAAPPQGYFMKLLTSAYLSAEVVAAYGFFISIAEKARQYIPLHFFYGLLEPIMVASYLKDRDFSALSQRCQLLYKSNLLLMVPAIAWVAVAGDPIVGLMTGKKFQGLSWILLLVMVQLTIGSHVVLLQLILNSLEKSKLLISAGLVALPIMLIAMAMAILTAPIALLISPILFSIVMNAYILFRLSSLSYPYYPSRQMIGGIILSGMISYAFVNFMVVQEPWNLNSLMLTTLSLFLVVLIYATFLWLMRMVSSNEINLVTSMIVNKKI